MTYNKALAVMEITYRALQAEDAEAYRDLRMKALDTEGMLYTADRELERAQTLSQWAQVCAETTKRVTFAGFDAGRMIATTAAEEHSSGKAWWRSTYIEPEYRRYGIAEKLFQMCTEWSVERGLYVVGFTIREDNHRSRQIQESNGAVIVDEKPMRFADGSTAKTFFYEKKLNPAQAKVA